jgi:hypothetical protein
MGKDSWRSSQTLHLAMMNPHHLPRLIKPFVCFDLFIHINKNGCFTHGKTVSPGIDMQGNMLCLVAGKME